MKSSRLMVNAMLPLSLVACDTLPTESDPLTPGSAPMHQEASPALASNVEIRVDCVGSSRHFVQGNVRVRSEAGVETLFCFPDGHIRTNLGQATVAPNWELEIWLEDRPSDLGAWCNLEGVGSLPSPIRCTFGNADTGGWDILEYYPTSILQSGVVVTVRDLDG